MSEAIKKLEDYRTDAFAKLRVLAEVSIDDLDLVKSEEQLRKIKELGVELIGKKSRIAEFKKEIGKVGSGDRAAFAQAVQSLEKRIREALERGETRLSDRISNLKTEQEA